MEIRTVVITKKFIILETKTDIKGDHHRKGFKDLKLMTRDLLTVEGSKIQI